MYRWKYKGKIQAVLYGCHTYEIQNAMLGYFVKFYSDVCQLHTLSNCQIPQSTLLFPNFANFTFPVCQLHLCQIVKSTLPQVHFYCLLTFTFAKLQGQNYPILKSALSSVHSQVADCTLLFCYFVKLPSLLHLFNCPNELQLAQVWYPSSTWAMAKWACKLPKSDFVTQLGQRGEWTSIATALRCDVQTIFHFLLDKLTQDPYGVEACHLFLLLS